MFFIAVSSFTLGLKIGRGKMCGPDGSVVSEEYKDSVDQMAEKIAANEKMLSKQEEMVNEVVSKGQDVAAKSESTSDGEGEQKERDGVHDRLKHEVDKLIVQGGVSNNKGIEESSDGDVTKEVEVKESVDVPKEVKDDKYTGKYTIQLGSYRTVKEAEQFAEGFRIRGYNPIISQGEVSKGQSTGVWYRVSLEVFNTASEAKDYIIKEKSLFQGENYVIRQFE